MMGYVFGISAGNTFEGITMLPRIERFIHRHPDSRPIIVADAAMVDQERLIELQNNNLSYIVGVRLANVNLLILRMA